MPATPQSPQPPAQTNQPTATVQTSSKPADSATPPVSAPQTPTPPTEPQQPSVTAKPAESTVVRLSGRGITSQIGTLSIKNAMQRVRQQQDKVNDKTMKVPLTKETVADYWTEMLNKKAGEMPRIEEALRNARVELQDNIIVIHTVDAYLNVEMRPFTVSMIEWMRHESGIDNLMFRLELEQIDVEVRPYTTNEKYDAMLKVNPHMEELKKILNDIEL